MLVNVGFRMQSILFDFAVRSWIQNKMPATIENLHPRVESWKSDSVSPPQARGSYSGSPLSFRYKEREDGRTTSTKARRTPKNAKVSRCRILTHKNGCGQFFRTRPQCNAHGRYIVHAGKEPYKPRSVEGWRLLKGTPGKNQIGFVMQTLVSDDQGLMCIEILVPTASVMVDAAWVRGNRGGTQLARQDRELEQEIEGIEVVSAREGTAVAPSHARDFQAGHRETLALSQIPPPTPTDRLHPGQPEIATPCIKRRIASQSQASSSF